MTKKNRRNVRNARSSLEQLRKKIAERFKVAEDQQNFLNWAQKTYDDRVERLFSEAKESIDEHFVL